MTAHDAIKAGMKAGGVPETVLDAAMHEAHQKFPGATHFMRLELDDYLAAELADNARKVYEAYRDLKRAQYQQSQLMDRLVAKHRAAGASN